MLQRLFLQNLRRLPAAWPRRWAATEAQADKVSLLFASSSEVFFRETPVQHLTVPTVDGDVGIHPTHVPLVGVLKPGVVTVTESESAVKKFFVSSGSLVINEDSSVQVLAEEACSLADLDAQECERGLDKARSQLQAAAGDEKAQAEGSVAIEVYEALVKACQEAS